MLQHETMMLRGLISGLYVLNMYQEYTLENPLSLP